MKPGPEHQVAYQDIVTLVRRHADKLTALELLAVAANMVGKLVALQDQRTTTREMAMKIVADNIEQGNAEAIEEITRASGRPN